jgi:hypothetical protein
MSANASPPVSTIRNWWCRTPVLAVVMFTAILLNNSNVIFRSRHYELNDYAADSLQVLKAKQFREMLGHNNGRFGFHHPGPAFFYVYALGEFLFYDTLHVVPTPFNGQLIMLYGLGAFFFSATLVMIARKLSAPSAQWFLGSSLLLAAWHFGAVGRFFEFIPGHPGFFCIWPPCVFVLPFLLFLVAAASVASGNGRDLPFLALAGSFLVHGYVSMPLFVVPLTLVAYSGLLSHSRSIGPRRAGWPWQMFPREHWIATVIIMVFLAPIVIDIVTKHPNNIQLIVNHLQNSHRESRGMLKSILYFLHFGAYAAYPNSNSIPAFEAFDMSGTISFFGAHWRAYGLWFIMVFLPIIILGMRGKRSSNDRDSVPSYANHPATIEFKVFLLWMYVVLASTSFLSLVWGCILPGTMYYYVSLSNFAIYYGFLLIFSIVAALWLDQVFPRTPLSFHLSHWRNKLATVGRILLVLGVPTAFLSEARRFRSVPPDQGQQRLFAKSMDQALRTDLTQPIFLRFELPEWAEATGVALYLERNGRRWMVGENWPWLFGKDRIASNTEAGQSASTLTSPFWRVVSHETSNSFAIEPGLKVLPLTNRVDLVIRPAQPGERQRDH